MPETLSRRLRGALPAAMKARDRAAVSALRATLAAIENAEAAEVDASVHKGLAIEQSPVGVGAREVPRRTLTEEQVAEIVRAEIAERQAAARHYDELGQAERAGLLRTEAEVLAAHL